MATVTVTAGGDSRNDRASSISRAYGSGECTSCWQQSRTNASSTSTSREARVRRRRMMMEAAAPQGAPRPEEAVPLQRAVHVLRPRACRGRLDSLHHQQRDLGIEPAAAQSVAPPPQNAHKSQDQGDVVVALRAPREACAAANKKAVRKNGL